MGWENVDISTVSPNAEPIPQNKEGYTYQLSTASYDANGSGRVIVKAFIVNDGEFQGRGVKFSYPNPDAQEWGPRTFRRLVEALGLDILPGEDPVVYLQRVIPYGARFKAALTHDKSFTPPGQDEPVLQHRVDIFNPKPAA